MKALNLSLLKKVMLIAGILAVIASLSSTPMVMGQDLSGQEKLGGDDINALEPPFITYLPCISNAYCAQTVQSPFSIQIAGLSEFVAPAGMSAAQADTIQQQLLDEYNAAFPPMMQALKDSGADWARIYINWSSIQPTETPTYNWTNYDNWLGQVAATGVKIIATVSNPPAWASFKPDDSTTCSNRIKADKVQQFTQFLTELVTRYKLSPYNIHVWEILNEPDAKDGYRCTTGTSNYGDHGGEYAALLAGASTAIKAVDPSAKIIMGGIAYDSFYLSFQDPFGDGSPSGVFNRYFVDDIMDNNAAPYLDAVNFHYFFDNRREWERWTVGDKPTCGPVHGGTLSYDTYGLDLLAKGSHFLNRLSTCHGVNKPLWITEVGMHGLDPTSPYMDQRLLNLYNEEGYTLENQARYVFWTYARGLSLGAENITWYALEIIPRVTPNDYQGLMYDSRDEAKDNQPKPAYYAFQALARELDGFEFSETLSAPANVEAYSFHNPCTNVNKIIAWYNQDYKPGTATVYTRYTLNSVSSVKLTYRPLAVGVKDTVIYDNDANDLDKVVGRIAFSLGEEPVIMLPNP